jgi:predicted GNAT family acetyltransferase
MKKGTEPPIEHRCVIHSSAVSLLAAAESFLARAPVAHNVIYGIATRLANGNDAAPDAFWATAQKGGAVVGAAMRTPPWKLTLGGDWAGLWDGLMDHLWVHCPALNGVEGPRDVVTNFASHWVARTGCVSQIGLEQRLYKLTEVNPPRPCAGMMRTAQAGDIALVARWLKCFGTEVNLGEAPEWGKAAKRGISQGRIWLWVVDGGNPVSLVASTRDFGAGSSVGPVYTPPDLRGAGYASNLVATLSQHLLDHGRAFCALGADVENPTSNRIYERLGYVYVQDFVDVAFGAYAA